MGSSAPTTTVQPAVNRRAFAGVPRRNRSSLALPCSSNLLATRPSALPTRARPRPPAVGVDALPVEGGLREPPLPAPEPSFAGQESPAEKAQLLAEVPALGEVAVVLE